MNIHLLILFNYWKFNFEEIDRMILSRTLRHSKWFYQLTSGIFNMNEYFFISIDIPAQVLCILFFYLYPMLIFLWCQMNNSLSHNLSDIEHLNSLIFSYNLCIPLKKLLCGFQPFSDICFIWHINQLHHYRNERVQKMLVEVRAVMIH